MTTANSKWTAVFLHGILSSGEIFEPMAAAFQTSPAIAQCFTFDYNYNASMMENARQLAVTIKDVATPVVLVCHSMGGLIARLGVLSGDLPNVRRIIMLGTPNFGAIRTSTAGFLASLVLRTTGRVAAVFRRPGILELTRVTKLLEDPIKHGEQFARDVEYVTIPATFFNESREAFDFGQWPQARGATFVFASLEIGADILRMIPFFRSELARPHDGIVEERSNSLVPFAAGHRSEKRATLLDPGAQGFTYAHVWIDRCDDLTHVMIHSDPEIVALVTRLAGSPSLMEWFNSLTSEERMRIKCEPKPLLSRSATVGDGS
jgi:pimeloyl-ACP methyl ester carboxylesterase